MSDNQPVQTQQAVQRWEYKKGSFSEEQLNKLGEDGWEVVGYNSGGVTILKRPKQ